MKGQVECSKARLIAAAEAVIAEFGWVGTSSRKIAARAELNLSLICYHFGGMDHLLVAAVGEAARRLAGHVAALPRRGDPVTLLESFLSLADDRRVQPTLRVLAEATLRATHDAAVAGEVRRFQLGLRKILRGSVAAALGRLEDPALVDAATALMIAALDGLLLHRAASLECDLAPLRAAPLRLVQE